MLTREMFELQRTLGYRWQHPALLRQALTHSSYGNPNGEAHNERYEFLGDSVLDLISAEWLMANHPNEDEGFMSKRRAELVCRDALVAHSIMLGIGRALLVHPRQQNLRETPSVLADAFEAVVGALYRDSHSIQIVRDRLLCWGVLS